MRSNLPNFRMPRAIDPRRHHDVRAWADAEHEAARRAAPRGWRQRAIYGLIAAGLLAVIIATLARLL